MIMAMNAMKIVIITTIGVQINLITSFLMTIHPFSIDIRVTMVNHVKTEHKDQAEEAMAEGLVTCKIGKRKDHRPLGQVGNE